VALNPSSVTLRQLDGTEPELVKFACRDYRQPWTEYIEGHVGRTLRRRNSTFRGRVLKRWSTTSGRRILTTSRANRSGRCHCRSRWGVRRRLGHAGSACPNRHRRPIVEGVPLRLIASPNQQVVDQVEPLRLQLPPEVGGRFVARLAHGQQHQIFHVLLGYLASNNDGWLPVTSVHPKVTTQHRHSISKQGCRCSVLFIVSSHTEHSISEASATSQSNT
jgi:hypothetical protein